MEKDIEILKESESTTVTKLLAASVVGSIMGLLIIITTKSPGQGGPIVVMLFLLFIFMCTLSFTVSMLRFIGRKLGMSGVRILYTSVAIAAGAVFLVGLQTLRQLQVVDLVLILVFELLLNFYLLRRF